MREQERRRSRRNRMLIAGGSAVLLVVALVVVQQLTSSGSSRPDASNLTGVADVQTEFAGLTERAGTIGNAEREGDDHRVRRPALPDLQDVRQRGRAAGHLRHRAPGHRQADSTRRGRSSAPTRSTRPRRPTRPPQQNSALALRRAHLPEPGRRERGVVHAGRGARHRPRRRPRHGALREGPRQRRLRPRRSARSRARRRAQGFQGTPTIRVAGPKGTITVDATYDAIATGVQQVSGSSAG